MEHGYTSWLAEALGVPIVEEMEGGRIRVNSVARSKLGTEVAEGLIGAIMKLSEGLVSQPVLDAAIARARAGEPAECAVGYRSRVLLMPIGKGRASAAIVPGESALASGTETERKAETVAAMSHELANALAAISGWIGLARSGGRVDEALELIDRASAIASGIARKMLGREDSIRQGAHRETDASAFVEEVTRLLIPKTLQSGVEVKTDITPGLKVPGRRDDVWTVIWNPMLNAVEAMPRGGILSVELKGGPQSVTFTVTDNGPGIDEGNLARIFQPYFTTKPSGTGIGLAALKRAVDEMGGTIQLSSSLGQGTRFRIDLPRAPETVREDSSDGGSDDRASGVYYAEPIKARILLVDDDPALREMMFTALSMRGAEVVAAASRDQALATQGHFDLALVDLRLGEQAGDALLAELRSADRIASGLLVTGSESLPNLSEGAEPDGVLRKPFQLEELYERVLDLLGKGNKQERAAG